MKLQVYIKGKYLLMSAGTNCKLIQFMTFRSQSVGVYSGYQARRSTQEQLKMTHIIFAILNGHITVVTYNVLTYWI